MLGRDGDAARLAEAVLSDEHARMTPDLAEAATMSLFRAGRTDGLFQAYTDLAPADAGHRVRRGRVVARVRACDRLHARLVDSRAAPIEPPRGSAAPRCRADRADVRETVRRQNRRVDARAGARLARQRRGPSRDGRGHQAVQVAEPLSQRNDRCRTSPSPWMVTVAAPPIAVVYHARPARRVSHRGSPVLREPVDCTTTSGSTVSKNSSAVS